jgi:hypothetical protein
VTACTFEIEMFQDDEEERWRLPGGLGQARISPTASTFNLKEARAFAALSAQAVSRAPTGPATSPAAQRQIGGIDPRPTAREERDGRVRDRPLGGRGRLDRNAEQMHWMHWGGHDVPRQGHGIFRAMLAELQCFAKTQACVHSFIHWT